MIAGDRILTEDELKLLTARMLPLELRRFAEDLAIHAEGIGDVTIGELIALSKEER